MTTGAPPGGPPAPKAKSAGSWLSGHKTQAYIGAAGIVVTIALYVKSRSNAAANAAGTTTSTTLPLSTANTTGTDAYNGIENQVTGLQAALLALQTGSASPSSSVPASSSAPAPAAAPSPQASAPALQPQTVASITASNLASGQNPTQAANNAGAQVAFQNAPGQSPATWNASTAASAADLAQFGL